MTIITEPWVTAGWPQAATPVNVRPVRPTDAGLIDAMHLRLSPDTICASYLEARIPTPKEIEQVCRIAPENGAGFVATTRQGREKVVGLAYYVREKPGRTQTAVPLILVEDQFQGQGIGRCLWRHLHDHAKANQIRQLRVLFDTGNQRVLRLLQGSSFPFQAKANWWLSEYLVALGQQPRPSRWLRILHRLSFLRLGQETSYHTTPPGMYLDGEPVSSHPYLIYPPAGWI